MLLRVVRSLPCHSVWVSGTLCSRSGRSHSALSDGAAQVVTTSLQLPRNAVSLLQNSIASCQHLKASGSQGFFSHSELPVPSSSSHSAMKRSKLLFKQVWPCALLSSGQIFRRHLMFNVELLTEMSYSLLSSWQTTGESQEEQKRFIGKKVFYYRKGKKIGMWSLKEQKAGKWKELWWQVLSPI